MFWTILAIIAVTIGGAIGVIWGLESIEKRKQFLAELKRPRYTCFIITKDIDEKKGGD